MQFRARIAMLAFITTVAALNADPVDGSISTFEFGCPADAKETGFSFDRYLFLHSFYQGVILPFGLEGKLSSADKAQIVHFASRYVSFDYPIAVSFPDYADSKKLIISYRLRKGKDGTTMSMLSNYDFKAKKIVTEAKAMEKAYAKLYLVSGGKLVPQEARFDAKKEAECLKAKSDIAAADNRLADMYLFDELPENDSRIEKLLLDGIAAAANEPARLEPRMTLAQYYLEIGATEKADSVIGACATVIAGAKIDPRIAAFLDVLKEESFIMKIPE